MPNPQSTQKGDSWNESRTYRDPLSQRLVRQLTTEGVYNQTPTYHTGTAFSADGRNLIFASARAGRSAMFTADTETGQLTQLTGWFDGQGCLDQLHKQNGVCVGNGFGVTMLACIAPKSRLAVFLVGRSVRTVHLDTLEERVIWENHGDHLICGAPSVNPSETHVLLPLVPNHPEAINDTFASSAPKPYPQKFADGGMRLTLMDVPLVGGPPIKVYEEEGVNCAHCPHCPSDDHLVMLDRDRAPNFWCGGDDGKTSRVWVLSLSNHSLTEIRPLNPQRFQVHSAWSWDGQDILYHGKGSTGGYYVGAARRDGSIINEYLFPDSEHYGHVSAVAGQKALLLDGNLTSDMLLMLNYEREVPRIEILARHGTDLKTLPWQYPHVHAQSDPQGRRVSFHSGKNGRADVFLLNL